MNKIISLALLVFLSAISCALATARVSTTPQTINFLNDVFDTNKHFYDQHDPKFFQEFKDTQSPHATHLGCADSRVHMDSLDQTPDNDVFSIRNIGNQMATSQGSIDYGVDVLKTPNLIIIGHSGCGAIKAAISGKSTNIPAIDQELSTIKLSNKELNKAIVENINNQVNQALKRYHAKISSGELTIIGMVYDFKNDFNTGYGRLILVNVNGVTDATMMKTAYTGKVTNITYLP